MGELTHFLHNHSIMLNEVKRSVDKDVECVGCKQPINRLLDSSYICSSLRTSTSTSSPSPDCLSFFMHKSCAELPQQFIHPKFKDYPLSLQAHPLRKQQYARCSVCQGFSRGLIYSSEFDWPRACLKCVMSQLRFLEDRNLSHPSHDHPLTLFQRPAFFYCDACNTTATDFSYVCTKCSFCMHKSCANAPSTYKCKFHDKHPLVLVYSLPEAYLDFVVYCDICDKIVNTNYWVYYCANCRFFAHVKCASSTEVLSKNENDETGPEESNLMHFPVADESSLNETMQQFIIEASNSGLGDDSAVAAAVPPDQINHWAHKHHPLVLRSRNATSPPDVNWKLAVKGMLICDGCIKPISLSDYMFYQCNSCNYILHTSCAQFPKEIQHNVAGKLVARGSEPYEDFKCQGCSIVGNGISMSNIYGKNFHIGCASLPKIIKHEAHHHPLYQCEYQDEYFCKACRLYTVFESFMFGCGQCGFYIHIGCLLKPRIITHRWDPHPLPLFLSSKKITDHPHDFECEFCSKVINPKTWFYHCSACDQSFHMRCTDLIQPYKNIKFGATNINSQEFLHPHSLTYLMNKKKRMCNNCGRDTRGDHVLECSTCKYIIHRSCKDEDEDEDEDD